MIDTKAKTNLKSDSDHEDMLMSLHDFELPKTRKQSPQNNNRVSKITLFQPS